MVKKKKYTKKPKKDPILKSVSKRLKEIKIMEAPLLEDVVKWIRNLEGGKYRKGSGALVSSNGYQFCCLGVWADQHGAAWDYGRPNDDPVPIVKGKSRPEESQTGGLLVGTLKYGLDGQTQNELARLNDDNSDWKEVIGFIRTSILPKAV